MKLYVREKPKAWINFIHDVEEFKEFEMMYIPGRKLVIGDISTFSKPMLNRLLKFIEENHEIDCYTSKDLMDPILLSRFVEVVKEPLNVIKGHSVDDYNNSQKSYVDAVANLSGLSINAQIYAPVVPYNMFQLLELL